MDVTWSSSGPGGPAPKLGSELRQLVRLALPLAAANLGQTLIGAVDTAVVGRLGALELGAAGLGNAVFFTVAVLGMGLMLGLDPIIAQAVGAGEGGRARHALWQGVWLSLLVTLPLTALTLLVGFNLEWVGIAPATAELTAKYVVARVPGLAPYLIFVALRGYLQAVGTTRPVVTSVVIANVINLPLSWVLVFGGSSLAAVGLPGASLPALGVAGAAWASSVCTAVQMLTLALAVRGLASEEKVSVRPDWRVMGRAFWVGTPVGLQLVAEFGVFSIVNLLMGNIDARALAAHQAALTLASTTFMVPVGIGAAASVRVGHAVGRGDVRGTRVAGFVSMGLATVFMLVAALAFLLAPRALASIITTDPVVVEAAVPLLFVAALFQLSDGVQAAAAGALRGAGDTRFALIVNLAGHYGVGLPVGVALAFGAGLGASGLWWGLSVGLTCVAVALALRFRKLSARPVARV